MKKKVLQLIGIFSAVVMLGGCTNPGTLPAGGVTEPASGITTQAEISGGAVNLSEGSGNLAELGNPSEEELGAISNASTKIMAETMKYRGEENVLISPTSIMMAFGMAENGANGETLTQMEQAANGGLSVEEMNIVMSKISAKLENANDVEWNVANSIWVKDREDLVANKDFLNKVVSYYHSEVWKAPFDDSTVGDINGWVSNNTKGMIPGVIDDISPNAVMFLINALCFEGEWAHEYAEDEIFEGREFSNLSGSTSQVNMMCSTENKYFELGKGAGFIKNYKGNEFSFVGILPDEGVTPKEYIADLSASGEDFSEVIRDCGHEEVSVQIPEFTYDYDDELSGLFESMGMTLPFDEVRADFGGMFSPDDQGRQCMPNISRIIHKTHIEVDRKGTRAAAVTAMEMEDNCIAIEETKELILNRPFVYAIVDNETGLPVFLGCVNNMP